MRIAFLHQPNDPYTEVRIKYFLNKGHEVYSISFPKKNVQKKIKGLKRIFLPDLLLNRIPLVKRFIYGLHIYKITKNKNLDILHIVNALNSFYLVCSKAKINILEIEGSDVLKMPKTFPFLKILYKSFFRYASGIIQDSSIVQLKGFEYGAVNDEKVNRVIEIGIDFSIFNLQVEKNVARTKLKIDAPIVFHSRGLTKIYNIDTIIKSISFVKEQIPDVKYVFAGYKEDLSNLSRELIKDKQIDNNVVFCGRLDHENEIKYFYKDATVVVSMPLSDSSPFSVYEAIACGTPVIVSELPWIKGKFIPNKHLITTPISDYVLLAEKIISIIKGDYNINLEEAFNIIYDRINMNKENEKLENFYFYLFKTL